MNKKASYLFRRDELKYLILVFALVVIVMSLIAPRHVNLVYQQPDPDTPVLAH